MKSSARQPLRSLLIAVLLALGVCACGSSAKQQGAAGTSARGNGAATVRRPGAGKPPVTLATKNFTEEFILGQLYTQALRAKGFTIVLTSDVGSSETVDRELTRGRIDGYPEYTGTILSALAHQSSRPTSAARAYDEARVFESRRGLTLLDMTPAADTDVIVAKPAYARRLHLSSLDDLQRLGSSVTLGAPPEFRTRFNGLLGLRQVYHVTGLRLQALAIGTQYSALDQGRVQLANVFTTDGELSAGGYTLLKDPQNIFGFQNVTFVMRKRVLEREGPAFAQVINAVSARLSTQALRVMNAAVVLDEQSPAAVAKQFLGAHGLI